MRRERAEPFTRVPQRRSLRWSEVSAYARAMAAELYRVHGADAEPGEPLEIRVPADWRSALAKSLELGGKERPPFLVALDAMLAAGLLVVGAGVVHLLYTDTALAAYERRTGTRPDSDPPHNGGTPAEHRPHTEGTPPAQRTHNGAAPESHRGSSARNRSGPLARSERQKEREREKSARARGAQTLEGQLQLEATSRSPVCAVRDLLAEVTGERWAVDSWHAELLRIAQRPLEELERVLAALRADPWVRDNPARVTPGHVERMWSQYARRAPAPARALPPEISEPGTGEACPADLLERLKKRTG